MTLLWSLAGALWLPWLDAQKSYQPVMLSLRQALPDTGECVSTARSNQLPRAMAYYYIGLSLPDSDSPVGQACRYRLITTPDPHYQPQGPWQARWRGARPAEKREFYVLLARVAD